MDFVTIVGLTAAILFVALVLRRVERRALGVFSVVLVVPLVVLIGLWAQLFGRWAEVGVAAAIAFILAIALGLLTGGGIRRASSDTIKVWGQEQTPRPTSAEAAEMRAELLRVKDERDRLEAEVKRLKDEGK
jgi:hypothetical protein